MKKEALWFYLAILWTAVGVVSILISWALSVELGIYWFGCILMGQMCFVHRKLSQIKPEK